MKFSRLVLPGITMIAATYGLARFSFGLLLSDMNVSLQMSDFVSGVISSLFYLSYCFTIIISIVLTTKKGPRKMILLAGLFAFIGLILMSVTPNAWVLALGVLFAGGSTGLISPPYGAAISLWIEETKQGKANTWINSGTSFGIILTGAGAILLSPNWRLTYMIYAALTLVVWVWNFYTIPQYESSPKVSLEKGNFSIKGISGAIPLTLAALIMGVSTAPFWTFSRSFIEAAGNYNAWQLSGFWIVIGLLGVLGGFSGSLIEKRGLSFSYKLGSLAIVSASIILALFPEKIYMSYLSAGIFGSSYIFLSGVLLVWGIRVFISNASLGIGVPFLVLAAGQVLGSILAGWLIGNWGYALSFIFYGLFGLTAILITPERDKKKTNVRQNFDSTHTVDTQRG